MKWLTVTDNQHIYSTITDALTSADKRTKSLNCNFDAQAIAAQKKNFRDLAGCFIYLNKKENFTNDEVALISSLAGFFAFDSIPIFSDIKPLIAHPFFAKDNIKEVQVSDLPSFISKKYKDFTASSIKRLAKNKLLDRGIPFTSDCFATYIAKGKIEVVNEFLEAGMSVNSRDDMGVPMLNIACRNDNFEFTKMILELGADLNASSDDRGYTAVMDAVWRGNEKITKYLIEKGADLNTINKEGQTNLILAVGASRESLVKLLAENGADPDAKDTMGMSAYNYATLFRKDKLVEILKPYHKEA